MTLYVCLLFICSSILVTKKLNSLNNMLLESYGIIFSMNELSFLKQCCLDINKMYLFCPSYYSTRLSNMISSPITNYISSMNNKELSFYVVLLHLSLIKVQNEPKEKSLQEINNENSTVFYCPIRNND